MTTLVRGSLLQWLGWAGALAAIVVTLGSAAGTQSGTQSAAATRAAAEKAFRAGKFDEVHTLAQASAGDETLTLLNARAFVAQGDYRKPRASSRRSRRRGRPATPRSSSGCCSSISAAGVKGAAR